MRAARATAARGLLVGCVAAAATGFRLFQSRISAERQSNKLNVRGHAIDAPPQNTQPYARYLDVHDDVQVAPIGLLVDLHRGVRDRLDLRALGMLLEVELLARRLYGGLEAWFALMYFD